MKPETMSSTPTAEERAEKRYPTEELTNGFMYLTDRRTNERKVYATCIREEVEPREAENARLLPRAEAFDQLDAYGCSSAKIWLDKCDEVEKLLALVHVLEGISVSVELFAGKWHAQFTIGNQTFKLRPLHMDPLNGPRKKDANWQADMLRIAFLIDKEAGFTPTNTTDK